MSEPCSQMRAYQNPTGTTPCPTQCTSTMYPLLAPSITSCLRKHGAGTNQTSQGSAFLVPEHSCISLISFAANWGPNLSYARSSDLPTNARPTAWSTAKLAVFWSPATLYSTRGAQNNTMSNLSSSTTAQTLPHPRHQARHHPLHPLLLLHLLLSQPNLIPHHPHYHHHQHARSAPPAHRSATTTSDTLSRRMVHDRALQNTRAWRKRTSLVTRTRMRKQCRARTLPSGTRPARTNGARSKEWAYTK